MRRGTVGERSTRSIIERLIERSEKLGKAALSAFAFPERVGGYLNVTENEDSWTN